MTTTTANYTTAADVFAGWRDDVLTGTPPTLYPIGDGELARIEVGPGLVGLFGGAPGAGKSAFTMQAVIDALRLTPTLQAVVCNIEMPPAVLLDYIQRIRPPGEHNDKRGSVDACMDYLRQFADAGVAVIVVSAVGRSKDKHGRNSYGGEGLNLASFRESSELEFGADSAFILSPDGGQDDDGVTLKHLKDRHGECRDIALRFDRARQSFTVADSIGTTAQADKADKGDKGKLRAALASLWNRTPAAEAGEGDDDE